MQLILAIDSDRRQAAQLARLVRGRLAVDLAQAASAGEALQVLGDRVPDLILTPALLSPFDDGVLAEYLRDLGPAGAHVQTLRIPVLGDGPARPARWSFLFRRRKPAPSSSPGCDPNVFADEVGLYLARAEQARQATEAIVGTHEHGDMARQRGAVPTNAWDVDQRRAQEPVRTLSDPEWSGPPTREPATWAARASAELAPIVQDTTAPMSSEWDVPDPVSVDEMPAPADLPDAEPVVTPAPPVAAAAESQAAPPPRRAGGEKGSPSFEAALAAIRAAWDTPQAP